MGILKDLKPKVTEAVSNASTKISVLSAEQLQAIEKKRDVYLTQMPDVEGDAAQERTGRLLAAAGVEIYHAYLAQLQELYVPVDSSVQYDERPFDADHNIRFLNITKWVIDQEADSLEKLVNVYEVLSHEACNISLVFHRTAEKTSVYLAVTNTENAKSNTDVNNYYERLSSAIRGNFPGSEWAVESAGPRRGVLPCLDNNRTYSVAITSNIPAEKSEKFISQTIEKLLDGIVPANRREEYTIILLATPVLDIEERKLQLTQLYTGLSPFASWSKNYTYNEQDTQGGTGTVNVNLGLGLGSQCGRGTARAVTNSGTFNAGLGIQGISMGGFLSHADTNTVSNTVGHTLGANFGVGFARASSMSVTVGKSESIQQNYTNYNIQHALENLQIQMRRMEQSTALGMWDFAAYVLSEDHNMANNVAHSYLALTQGEESYLSQAAINLWRGDTVQDERAAKEICSYLRQLRHPIFGLAPTVTDVCPEYSVYPTLVTATVDLSGKELAYSLNFPGRSVAGLPVLTCAEFGRNVVTCRPAIPRDKQLALGKIFHMNKEENTQVFLSQDSLTAHALITGSTGSGKSNTVYQILDKALENNITFLVIEPAKGEYKNLFGNDENVCVLGTNPRYTELLRIDPFAFPQGIHILEHIDRLIEIFNVCWPMYAAMPAVLKDAVLSAYEDCGWDLTPFGRRPAEAIYPTFADVEEKIREVVRRSDYSSDSKGDYIGSLVTRVHSLTNGLNGQIFTPAELSDQKLFDQNVIIDLSRIQSQETKALIMGVLVMRLNEYRMSATAGMNQPLKHLTVLEEAHHLLKRSSSMQDPDAPCLASKSVEMLVNSIAEMRTYGEGFIIVDQSPSALDPAAIRNTNTKIIMRLPDETDRRLAGKSAGMKDNQLDELAKLIKGVAVVYQNDWLEPVLCKIHHADHPETPYQYLPLPGSCDYQDKAFRTDMLWLLLKKRMPEEDERGIDLKKLRQQVLTQNISVSEKRKYLRWIETYKQGDLLLWRDDQFDQLSDAVVSLMRCKKKVSHMLEQMADVRAIDRELQNLIWQQTDNLVGRQLLAVEQCILWDCCKQDRLALYNVWRHNVKEGKIR